MRKLIPLLFTVLFLFNVKAQNKELLYDFAELPQALMLNPGTDMFYKSHVGIPLLSHIHFNYGLRGFSPSQLLAKDGIKTLNEIATCADWELAGGYTTVEGKRVKDDGLLETLDVSLEEAQKLVITARLSIGLITQSEYNSEMEENSLENGNDSIDI